VSISKISFQLASISFKILTIGIRYHFLSSRSLRTLLRCQVKIMRQSRGGCQIWCLTRYWIILKTILTFKFLGVCNFLFLKETLLLHYIFYWGFLIKHSANNPLFLILIIEITRNAFLLTLLIKIPNANSIIILLMRCFWERSI